MSRSYCYPYALVAWHSEPVGIDIEQVVTCDAAFAESICTPAERLEFSAVGDRDTFFSSVWCSKEALSKALGDPLDFDPRRLESPLQWPNGEAGPWRTARLELELELAPRRVAWVCWRSSAIEEPNRDTRETG